MSIKSTKIAKELFLKSVNAVKTENLIAKNVSVKQSGHLVVKNKTYKIRKPCYVIGFGKAVLGMAEAIEKILGHFLEKGIVTVPKNIFQTFPRPEGGSKIDYIEGAYNNLPDLDSQKGALQICELVQNLTQDDTVIVLISGGGSALLPLPRAPVTLQEKSDLISKLSKAGADIFELNSVRKQISQVKGGNLAKMCHPAQVIGLILSDVVGDPLDFIASGPTCKNMDPPLKAIDILKKYNIFNSLSKNVQNTFIANPNNPKNGDFSHVDNYIIGNNELATQEALTEAKKINFQSIILSNKIVGNVDSLSQNYAKIAFLLGQIYFCRETHDLESNCSKLRTVLQNMGVTQEKTNQVLCFDKFKKMCLICGGEPTVNVTGHGKGGRNQQLALSFAVHLNKLKSAEFPVDITFLSCGTDGIDGPTDAAGAITTSNLFFNYSKITTQPDAEKFLINNDSYNFFTKCNNSGLLNDGAELITTGHTGTNVMDIHILIIDPKM